MAKLVFKRVGTIATVEDFVAYCQELGIELPCDNEIQSSPESPLASAIDVGMGKKIGNRFAIHPMEGWDGTRDGKPTEHTIRRWKRFGQSGAKLIWGGEAVAVHPDGRANPNQLMINQETRNDLAHLRQTLIDAHREQTGDTKDLLIGLQLTHSGRFAKPNCSDTHEPLIAYRHPLLDQRVGVINDDAILTDEQLREIIACFIGASKIAWELGYDFVDLKHCHGYLGHELLSGRTRPGPYGGNFENRTRFLREIVAGVRREVPGLQIGVRVSAFDILPFKPNPDQTQGNKLGPGIPEENKTSGPYPYGFGINVNDPLQSDLTEPMAFLELLEKLDIKLVNISAGSPYYNPHIQRPALYPPSDGYQPPEDPLVGVARQMQAVRTLKKQFPNLILVGSGYTYLQDYLPHVAQAAVRLGWVDSVGLGRMVLSYPQLPHDVLTGQKFQSKRICRTFSDCTTAPRKGIISGCYPLDSHYKSLPQMTQLRIAKSGK